MDETNQQFRRTGLEISDKEGDWLGGGESGLVSEKGGRRPYSS